MPHRILSHTADTGIEATAPSLDALIEELAVTMASLTAQPSETDPSISTEFSIEAASVEDLVVDALAKLVARSEIDDAVFSDVTVTTTGPVAASVRARGRPIAELTMVGPPIKAITYHGLVVEKRTGEWFARVYLDV